MDYSSSGLWVIQTNVNRVDSPYGEYLTLPFYVVNLTLLVHITLSSD